MSYSHKKFKLLLLGVLVGSLVACGDSDLEELQSAERSAAERAISDTPVTGVDPEPEPDVSPDPATEDSETDKIKEAFTLVFNEEFDGATIDSSRWNTQLKWGPDVSVNNDMQYYVDVQNSPDFGFNPFVFDGNVLSVTAQKTETDQLANANNQPYLSGVLSTHDKFDFRYGYAEISAKLPAGAGYWPGFWMLTSEFVEKKPQIFVMEARGDNTNSVFHRYNFTDASGTFQPSEFLRSDADGLSTDFHAYGLLWGPDSIAFYVDGVKTHTIDNGNTPTQDLYLILNLAIGNDFAGAPTDDTVFPGSLDIDYVRIYQSN